MNSTNLALGIDVATRAEQNLYQTHSGKETTFEVNHVKYVLKTNPSVLYLIRFSVQSFFTELEAVMLSVCERTHGETY